MPDFFYDTYYNNTLLEWLTSLSIILGTFIVIKIVYLIFSRLLLRITARTKSEFDDVLVELTQAPIVTLFTIAGIWAGIRSLTLPEAGVSLVNGAAFLCAVLSVTWLCTRVIDAVFQEVLAPLAARTETDLDDQFLPVARKGIKLVIWSMGTIIGLDNVGYDVGAVLAGLGIGGLALAMAARDTVANFFGGVTVFTDRPFTVHDRIRIGEYEGFVQEIGIRSTRIRTLGGPIVIIPNSRFSDSAVENVSVPETLQAEVVVGLTYDTDHARMKRAIEFIETIVEDHPDAEIWQIGFENFGDFSLNIRCIYYFDNNRLPLAVMNEINMAVLEKFNREGLEFAFPTRTLHVTKSD